MSQIRIYSTIYRCGDDFPNTEVIIYDSNDSPLVIGFDRRDSDYDEKPTILFGGATEELFKVNMKVKVDPETGAFKAVWDDETSSWIERTDWNNRKLEEECQ